MERVNSQGVVGLGAQARRGLPYLDLLGVKGHDEAEEEEGGNADEAFNQEQVERPLLGGRGKGVRSPVSTPSTLYVPPKQPSLLNSLFPSLLSFQPLTWFLLMCLSVLGRSQNHLVPRESALFLSDQTALVWMPVPTLLLGSSPQTLRGDLETHIPSQFPSPSPSKIVPQVCAGMGLCV